MHCTHQDSAMKILVTGGAGFIGSHVTELLIAAGHEVHVLDNLSTGRRQNVRRGVPLHCLDIRDSAIVDLLRKERYEVLAHHAAQMDVRRSVEDPAHDLSVNLAGFLNLMEAGRVHGLKRVIFASTGGAIYGEPEEVPQTEAHVLRPVSPYGITKLATEKYLHFYDTQFGIPYVALRYGNVYGPRQNPHGEAGVVAIFTQRILDGMPVVINGDGLQTRDYIYVKDVARANIAALSYDGPSCTVNIGTGRETDVVALYQAIRRAVGVAARVRHAPAKKGEQRRSVLGCALAKSTLDWSPEVSMREGLEETTAWFASRWQP